MTSVNMGSSLFDKHQMNDFQVLAAPRPRAHTAQTPQVPRALQTSLQVQQQAVLIIAQTHPQPLTYLQPLIYQLHRTTSSLTTKRKQITVRDVAGKWHHIMCLFSAQCLSCTL